VVVQPFFITISCQSASFSARKLADLVSAQSAHPLERSGYTSDGGLVLPYQPVGTAK
jgi:hypothetical protein